MYNYTCTYTLYMYDCVHVYIYTCIIRYAGYSGVTPSWNETSHCWYIPSHPGRSGNRHQSPLLSVCGIHHVASNPTHPVGGGGGGGEGGGRGEGWQMGVEHKCWVHKLTSQRATCMSASIMASGLSGLADSRELFSWDCTDTHTTTQQ